MLIAKADGTQEEFDPAKLLSSLRRAGADPGVSQNISKEIEGELYPGITTNEIYRRAFAHLREARRSIAARYSLKRAILDFGPSGFPFEVYIAELYRAEGYKAAVDQLIAGTCVTHEVDVVATRGSETLYIEAKFHNSAGYKTDLKTVLYVQARMRDIGKGEGLVVTNTKFTSVAVQYAKCQNLALLGWEYPEGATLHDRIEAAGVYPITALTTLNRREKTALLVNRVVLCNDLRKQADALSKVGISHTKIEAALAEGASLCTPSPKV